MGKVVSLPLRFQYEEYTNWLEEQKKKKSSVDSIKQEIIARRFSAKYGIELQDVLDDLKLDRKKCSEYIFLVSEWAKRVPPLTDKKIENLLQSNKLDKKYGITVADVRQDIADYLKNNPSVISHANNNGSNNKNNVASNNKSYVSPNPLSNVVNNHKRVDASRRFTSSNYLFLLDEWIKLGSKLTDKKIHDLIISNKLDVTYGLTVGDVKRDIQNRKTTNSGSSQKQPNVAKQPVKPNNTTVRQNNNATNTPAVSKAPNSKNGNGNENTVANNAPVRTQAGYSRKISHLTSDDKLIASCIKETIMDYPDIICNQWRIRNVLADVIPDKKMHINLLGQLAEFGILDDINGTDSLDYILCNKYVSVLEQNYGTSREIAQRMVLIWFHGYGRLVLRKTVEMR